MDNDIISKKSVDGNKINDSIKYM